MLEYVVTNSANSSLTSYKCFRPCTHCMLCHTSTATPTFPQVPTVPTHSNQLLYDTLLMLHISDRGVLHILAFFPTPCCGNSSCFYQHVQNLPTSWHFLKEKYCLYWPLFYSDPQMKIFDINSTLLWCPMIETLLFLRVPT
jgi:hypothetical protein